MSETNNHALYIYMKQNRSVLAFVSPKLGAWHRLYCLGLTPEHDGQI